MRTKHYNESMGLWEYIESSGELNAANVPATVPDGLPADTGKNVQAVLDAEKVLTDGYVIGSKEKAAEFAALFANTGTVESFLFFTDPHLQRVTSPKVTGEMLAKIRDVYRSTPTSFVLCGGDWLNSGDTTESACYLLGSYDAYMRKNCAPYVPVVGNHDTNYQNRAFEETAPNYNRAVGLANALPQKVVNNLLFREEGKAYYAFRAPQSTVYVLDTGIDWVPDMDEYRWEQIDWLATKMITDAAEHSFIACHIAYNNANVPPMTHNIAAVINAFNNRSTLSLNGHTYDFSGMSGTCHFILAGHNHADYCGDVDGVPTILTTNVMDTTYPGNKWPAFDLCLADYDAAVLHLVRVGNGINRDIPIIPDLGLGLPVTYGLVFHLDGKNRGTVPGEWKELVSGSPVKLKYCEEKADCVGFSGSAGGRFNAFGDFGTNTLTIECVFKPDTAAANMSAVLFNTRSTQTLYSNNVGVYNGLYISDSRKQNPTYVTHFNAGELITVSISKARAIENGEVLIEGTPEVYGGTDGSQTLISIGAQAGPSSKYHFHGDIYAIRVYNRVLTEAEIQRNQQYDRKTYFGSGTSELH